MGHASGLGGSYLSQTRHVYAPPLLTSDQNLLCTGPRSQPWLFTVCSVNRNSYSLEPLWRGGSDALSLVCLRRSKTFARHRKPYEISGFRNFDTRMRSRRDEMYLAGTAVLELLGEPRAQSVTTAACCFASARDAVGERRNQKVAAGPRSPASSQSGMPRVPAAARSRQRARPALPHARNNPAGGAGPAKSALPRALESY